MQWKDECWRGRNGCTMIMMEQMDLFSFVWKGVRLERMKIVFIRMDGDEDEGGDEERGGDEEQEGG